MKSNIPLCTFSFFLLVLTYNFNLYSQNTGTTGDRVFLTDGSVVEGTIEAVKSDVVVFIQKETGVRYEYKKREIKVIILANGKYLSFDIKTQPERSSAGASSEVLNTYFKVFGGISIPLGEFSSVTGSNAGYAKTGYIVGAEFNMDVVQNVYVGIAGDFNFNSIDGAEYQKQMQSYGIIGSVYATQWTYFSVLGNLGFDASISDKSVVYVNGKIGLAFGSSPDITISADTIRVDLLATSTSAIAYGFSVGVIFAGKVDFGLRYLASTPEADVTTRRSYAPSITTKEKQPISVLQVTVGIVF